MRVARKEVPGADRWLPVAWALLIITLGTLAILSRGEALVFTAFATSVAVFPLLMLDVKAGALSWLALVGALLAGLGPAVPPFWLLVSGNSTGGWEPAAAAAILTVAGGCLIHLGNRKLITLLEQARSTTVGE